MVASKGVIHTDILDPRSYIHTSNWERELDYQQSWLWQNAFVMPRKDAPKEEQNYFGERYYSMREKAAHLVGRIHSDLKTLTVHDKSHLDALWEMASIVTEGRFDLNPPEAFVFGGAILLHDAAMTLAAYPGGQDELRETVYWKDSFARLTMEASNDWEDIDPTLNEKIATAETLRRLHAGQAGKLPTMRWTTFADGDPEYLIDDPEIRKFYGPKIGQVAQSHWWSIEKVEEDLSNDLGPLGGRTGNRIDLIKIASLLRISDAMHLDRRRAPTFLRKLLNPIGESEKHWIFQERMAVPYVENDALVYSAAPAFELDVADAWWLAYDALTSVDRELRGVDHLLQKRSSPRLNANRIKGIDSPTQLSHFVETTDWVPVNSTVRVSDVPKIVSTLGGRKLYGNDSRSALRELLQNAADAIDARRKLQKRDPDWGTITVSLETIEDEEWLTVDDTGVGMSSAVLTGPLIDFGNSFWRTPLAAEEFPGLHASGVSPRGHYGIGFFSVFMLGSRVVVSSRKFDKASDSIRTLEFRDGLSSRPILYPGKPNGVSADGGTRVSVKLDRSLTEEGGLLYSSEWEESKTLRQAVAAVAPNLDTKIVVKDGEGTQVAVVPKDWLDLDESNLVARLAGKDTEGKMKKASRLRALIDDHGAIFGRAAIETAIFGSGGMGCITVGGLRASEVSVIRGVLVGREHTAARNEAFSLVPPHVLATWATEQGKLINRASLDSESKSRGANVVLQFGGAIGNLPIGRWMGEWITTKQLEELLSETTELMLFFGKVSYDEEIDDVHPRDFSHSFKESLEVLFVPDELPGFKSSVREAILGVMGKLNHPSNLPELVTRIIEERWIDNTEESDERIVGTVNGSEIVRQVTVISRQ